MNCPKCKGKMNTAYEGSTYNIYKCLCGFEQIAYRGDTIDSLRITIGFAIKRIEVLESVVKNLRVGNILEKKVLERIDALEERLKEFLNTYHLYNINHISFEDHMRHLRIMIEKLEGKQ